MDGAYDFPLALSQFCYHLLNWVHVKIVFQKKNKKQKQKQKDQRKQIPVNSKGSSIQSLYWKSNLVCYFLLMRIF